jgi:hypothetical protein
VLGVPGAAYGVGKHLHEADFPDTSAFGGESAVVPHIHHAEPLRHPHFKEHVFALELFVRGVESEVHDAGESFAETEGVVKE